MTINFAGTLRKRLMRFTKWGKRRGRHGDGNMSLDDDAMTISTEDHQHTVKVCVVFFWMILNSYCREMCTCHMLIWPYYICRVCIDCRRPFTKATGVCVCVCVCVRFVLNAHQFGY